MLELLKKGMTPNKDDKGVSWIQNLQRNKDSWEVRPGFGTRATLDTCLTTGKEQVDGQPVGLQRHLGSYLLRDTGFGHKQIISIFRTLAYTSDFLRSEESAASEWTRLGQYRVLYTAFVYDLTTDERFEIPFVRHTSQVSSEISDRHANYETSRGTKYERDYQVWINAGQNEASTGSEFNTDEKEFFWFTEQKDNAGRVYVFFGNARAGAWFYTPIDPRYSEKSWRQRRMAVNGIYTQDFKDPYGEVSCIQPLVVRDGIFTDDGITYTTNDEFGLPQAACALGRRMVYAVGNVLYFSDPEDFNAIMDGNIQGFKSNIVAVAATLGNLLVWTEDGKTHYYNPAQGDLISGGRTVTISDDVGILNPNSWVNVNGAIIWVDKNGIYRNYGNTTVQRISDNLELFFQRGISNGLMNYYTYNGASQGTDPQPHTFYEWNRTSQVGVNLSYQPTDEQIFINIPFLNISFVIEDGGFHVWNYESIVSMIDSGSFSIPDVAAVQNMPQPWVLGDTNSVFMVTDVTTTAITDETIYDENATDFNTAEGSFSILELGRGGGIDASISSYIEDRRTINGEWFDNGISQDITSNLRDRGFYFINKPIKIPDGYNFTWAGASVDSSSELGPIWIPIELVPVRSQIGVYPETLKNIEKISMEFKFDNTSWAPYINANATESYEPVFDLPPERLGAKGAYFVGSANETLSKGVRVYDSGGATPSATGDTIRIDLNAASGSHVITPKFGLIPRYRNPILMMAFYKKASANNDSYAPAFENILCTMSGSHIAQAPLRVWNDQARGLEIVQNTNTAQSVDWMYTAKEISSDDTGFMMKARGINIDVESSSNATLQSDNPGQGDLPGEWPIRVFNVLTSTNYKHYAAQLLDFTSDPAALIRVAKDAVRNRMGTSAVQFAAKFSTIGGKLSTTKPKWGDHDVSTEGNLLIGDPEYDNIKTSVGVKGDRIIVQMFGHILSPAEKLRVGMAKLFTRIMPGLRRRGR